eukprot:3831416-Amphidinium_carterae.1
MLSCAGTAGPREANASQGKGALPPALVQESAVTSKNTHNNPQKKTLLPPSIGCWDFMMLVVGNGLLLCGNPDAG